MSFKVWVSRCAGYWLLICAFVLGVYVMPVAGAPVQGNTKEASVPASIKDYRHSSWRQQDGAPASVWAIAQTPDGWLWLGTPSGLYRFDGVSFESYDLLPRDNHDSRSVTSLHVSQGGDLWVLYSAGGAAVWHRGASPGCCQTKGLPIDTPVDKLAEMPSGQMLALAGGKFYVLVQDIWRRVDASTLGLSPEKLYDIQRYGDELWASASDGLYVLSKGQSRFIQREAHPYADADLIAGGNGELWRHTDGEGFVLLQSASASRSARRPNTSSPRVVDHQGSIWTVVCGNAAVCRTKHASAANSVLGGEAFVRDRFGAGDGLPLPGAMTAFEDRNGDLWFGTKLGLERFSQQAFVTVHFPIPQVYFAMVPEADGSMWIGTGTMGLQDAWWSVGDHGPVQWSGFGKPTTAAYRDHDGTILLGSQEGLWQFDGKNFHSLDTPSSVKGIKLQALARDSQQRLWASFRGQPVYAQIDGRWTAKGGLKALPDQSPTLISVDRSGTVWFGYFANQLAIVNDGKVSVFGPAQGLDLGTTTALITVPPVLVGGERGLAVFDGKRFRRIDGQRPDALAGITGLLRTEDGTVWINGNAGAIRIAKEDIARAIIDSAYKVPLRIFDNEDGVSGGAQQVRPLPTLVEGGDGRLWFAGTTGVAWIDPSTLRYNPRPPTLVIRAVEANGRRYDPAYPIKLAPHTHDLQIAYTALEALSPAGQSFRYKLEGLNQEWQNVGARREAIYTNLGPGHYTFRLQGANEDGIWNVDGAYLTFDVAPSFYETRWFMALIALATLLLAWSMYAIRLRYVKRNMRERLDTRHAERERIARDLHDTLLQGIQGLLLRLQVWAVDSAQPEHRRDEISECVKQVRTMLVDGRNRIMELRSDTGRDECLEDLLGDSIRGFSAISNATCALCIKGEARPVHPDILPDVVDIAREAIRNAAQHAGASTLHVAIAYDDRSLAVSVVDDGCGIPGEVLRGGGRLGHWGLCGMKERAERISSRLYISPRMGGGTEINLVVPARMAYGR